MHSGNSDVFNYTSKFKSQKLLLFKTPSIQLNVSIVN